VALGIMKGNPQSLIERDAHALFFPHGLGHLVGLGVRDGSGRAPGRAPSARPGLANLRVDLPLERGYAITVEPGVYFIPALLNDPTNREKYRDAVDWDRVVPLLDFGGIRIEDNVVVTDGAPEVLTAAIPKTLD
jgi:Xaa-Pro aminopeptidase